MTANVTKSKVYIEDMFGTFKSVLQNTEVLGGLDSIVAIIQPTDCLSNLLPQPGSRLARTACMSNCGGG